MLFLYSLCVFIVNSCSVTGSSCKPSVEGETYNFRHVFEHVMDESLELVLLKNSFPISTCRKSLACYDYNTSNTVTTLRSLGEDLFEVNHTIRNVTKADAGTYKLKYLGLASLIDSQPLYNCYLLVYAISVLALEHCPHVVEAETEVQCLCKKKDDISEDFELHWLDRDGTVKNNGSPLLSFVITRNDLGYTCHGWRSDGVESKPLGYRPNISISANISGTNLIRTQEPSFILGEILMATGAVLLLVLLLILMLYRCFRKEDAYPKITSVKCKDLIIENKYGFLTHSQECQKSLVEVETKYINLLSYESYNTVNLRFKKNNTTHHCEWHVKDFNIINDSDDSEGYISMADDNS